MVLIRLVRIMSNFDFVDPGRHGNLRQKFRFLCLSLVSSSLNICNFVLQSNYYPVIINYLLQSYRGQIIKPRGTKDNQGEPTVRVLCASSPNICNSNIRIQSHCTPFFMHKGQRFFKSTLANFCKSIKCINFNVDYRRSGI